ncbi:MAG: prepilin-type N-terminal cleavage/methylation domain-containing protein [Candidatus Omnitrophica bacterium]|nr:prepilin-type N-terminal cleavage/methylation domain-containing protein [Candidatus Omnitrophota bacterium]
MEDRSAGLTLLEILLAMLILALVTGGIFTAFVFGRRTGYRSESELIAAASIQGVAEELRLAVSGDSPTGLTLSPGLYVDEYMVAPPAGANTLAALDMPPDWRAKYQTNAGRTPAPTMADHGDGRMAVVEELSDLDGDGLAGIDFNGDGEADLRRVRVRLRWTTPSANQ